MSVHSTLNKQFQFTNRGNSMLQKFKESQFFHLLICCIDCIKTVENSNNYYLPQIFSFVLIISAKNLTIKQKFGLLGKKKEIQVFHSGLVTSGKIFGPSAKNDKLDHAGQAFTHLFLLRWKDSLRFPHQRQFVSSVGLCQIGMVDLLTSYISKVLRFF